MKTYSTFASWAAAYDTQKVYVAELTALKLSDNSLVTLYFSDDSSGVWDGIHFFEPYIIDVPQVKHKAQQMVWGRSLVAYGDISLAIQPDKTVDPAGTITWSSLLSGYTFAGHPITVKVGGPELPNYANWGTVLVGYMGPCDSDDTECSIPIFSSAKKAVETPIPPNEFPATVSTNSIGQPIPLAYGEIKNLSPPLINSAKHIYKIHDESYGALNSIDAVYVNGLKQGAGFTASTTLASITFAADPQGAVTCDVKGAKVDGSYINTPGAIAQKILQKIASIATESICTSDFAAYATAVPYTVGIYINQKTNIGSALDDVTKGLPTVWGTDRRGCYTIGRFTEATGTEIIELTDVELLEAGWGIETEERIFYKVTMRGEENKTTIESPSASVSEDHRTFLKNQWRERTSTYATAQIQFPNISTELVQDSSLACMTNAETVAGWWTDLFGVRRRIIKARAKMQPLLIKLNDVVKITRDYYGLSAGLKGRVVSLTENHDNKEIDLEIWV